MSTFSTINVALTGIMAHQKAIEVTSNNVANANTPGYHRQEIMLRAMPPYPLAGNPSSPAGGQYGTGVDMYQVRRMQNTYLQQQSRMIQGEIGRWSAMTDGLTQVESILAPGTGKDLSARLDSFFSSWQQLATNPEDDASRLTVRSTGQMLTSALNMAADQLNTAATQAETTLVDSVNQLNTYADHLASLNSQIGMARAEGREPNDLLDERDTIMSEMTQLAGISTLSNASDGSAITNLGGRALVEGTVAHHLVVDSSSGAIQLTWEDGAPADVTEGKIGGLYELRDSVIPGYLSQLDQLAGALAGAVNALHNTGMTTTNTPAGDFFTGTTAGSIRIADDILDDVGNIASTTQADAPGDGTLATLIHNLANSPLIGTQTLNQHAQSLLSQIGQAVQGAQVNYDVNTAMQSQIATHELEASGVSLDEEMANLLIYQRAYDASARVLKAADEMTQIILERLG